MWPSHKSLLGKVRTSEPLNCLGMRTLTLGVKETGSKIHSDLEGQVCGVLFQKSKELWEKSASSLLSPGLPLPPQSRVNLGLQGMGFQDL